MGGAFFLSCGKKIGTGQCLDARREKKTASLMTACFQFHLLAGARLAQSVECRALNLVVVGSSPTVGAVVKQQSMGGAFFVLSRCVGKRAALRALSVSRKASSPPRKPNDRKLHGPRRGRRGPVLKLSVFLTTFHNWLLGLVAWFSLRVREVLGSIPRTALCSHVCRCHSQPRGGASPAIK